MDVVRSCDGVATALSRDRAAEAFALPADAIGDIVVCGDRCVPVGMSSFWLVPVYDLAAASPPPNGNLLRTR